MCSVTRTVLDTKDSIKRPASEDCFSDWSDEETVITKPPTTSYKNVWQKANPYAKREAIKREGTGTDSPDWGTDFEEEFADSPNQQAPVCAVTDQQPHGWQHANHYSDRSRVGGMTPATHPPAQAPAATVQSQPVRHPPQPVKPALQPTQKALGFQTHADHEDECDFDEWADEMEVLMEQVSTPTAVFS